MLSLYLLPALCPPLATQGPRCPQGPPLWDQTFLFISRALSLLCHRHSMSPACSSRSQALWPGGRLQADVRLTSLSDRLAAHSVVDAAERWAWHEPLPCLRLPRYQAKGPPTALLLEAAPGVRSGQAGPESGRMW